MGEHQGQPELQQEQVDLACSAGLKAAPHLHAFLGVLTLFFSFVGGVDRSQDCHLVFLGFSSHVLGTL